MMLWFFGYKLGWFPIGKFLYPEKWYDAPFDSDVLFSSAMIKFTLVVSLLTSLLLIQLLGVSKLCTSRRNIRFASLIAIFIGGYFYWNTGEALARKPYAADIAYHMILPVLVVTIVAFAGTALAHTYHDDGSS